MGTLLSVEQGILETSVGDYHIPICHFSGNRTDTSWSYNYQKFAGVKWDFFYDGNTDIGVEFTFGDNFAAYRKQDGYFYVKCNNVEYRCGSGMRYFLSWLCYDSQDLPFVWEILSYNYVIYPLAYNPTFFNFYIASPVTTTSFGYALDSVGHDSGYNRTAYPDQNYFYWGNYYIDHFPPEYNWKSWTSLRGNGGRYRASLTKITETSIGDFSGQITGSISDMDYVSSQVDMIPVVQNMLYDVEQTIAWSGSTCWMTLTVHAVSGQPTKAQLMFKFYAESHSTTTPLFSFASEIGVSGTAPDKHFYLAFVYDDENQAALFCPVTVTNSGSYIWGYVNAVSDVDMLNIWQWLHMTDAGEDDRPDNPYDVGTPDNGGTDGVIQPPDEINPGQIPTLDATTKGLFTVYLPSETQLGDIASFMWSDDVLDNFKKYFNNFNQNILALYVLPYAPTNPPTKPFKVGRIESDTITAVGYLNQRFVSIDMGEFTVKPRWGSYLDYAPYTKFEIYLPGIGMQVLDTDDIMSVTDKDGNVSTTAGSVISLEYHVDLITGVCVAYVKINNDVKYQFPGKLGYTIPLTGEDYGRMITAFATVAAGVAGGIAYGGISAPLKNPAIGHMVGGEVSAAVAGTVNAMKPEIHRSGNLSCEASALSTDTPYLIRSMPNKPELVNQQVFTGFPSYKSGVLSDFDGYTECIDAHVEGISCTEDERKMLIEWLRKGVIL